MVSNKRDVYLGPKRLHIEPDQSHVVGSGGEAIIYSVGGGKVLKIYHQPTQQRSEKLAYHFSQNATFPRTVFAPEIPVYGSQRDSMIVGFQMGMLPSGAEPMAMLMRHDFCDQYGITNQMKAKSFSAMLSDIQGVHRIGDVLGDLNDQNAHFDLRKLLIYWIDVDSRQIGNKFPCSVGTEDYLSPDLYGIDLALKPVFKPEHDYYSFAVLFFRALMMAHPFKSGYHRLYKSLFERAKNGMTILDDGVNFPKTANSPDIMTDDMANLLLQYLKRQRKDPFPMDALREYAEILVECSCCHVWYPATRGNCPGCSNKTILAAQMAVKVAGCACRIMLETPGTILHFQLVGSSIYCLAEESGMVVLYIQPIKGAIERKELFTATTGAKYAFFGETLVVCPAPTDDDPKLFLLDVSKSKIRPITQSTTRKFGGGSAVFGCSSRRLYRLVGNKLMSGNLFGDHLAEREVIDAMPNQTWFSVGNDPALKREILVVCHRIFDELKWFLVEGEQDGRAYIRHEVAISPLLKTESLVDVSVRFSNETVLVMRQTKMGGTKYVRIEQIEVKSGKLLYFYRQKEADAALYQSIHSKGYVGQLILHATDDGIIMEKVADRSVNKIDGTENYVTSTSQLHPYEKGVLAVGGGRILYLTPESK